MQELKFDPDNINVSIQPTDVVYVTSLVNEQSGINTPSYPHPKPRAIGVVYDVDLEKGIILIDDSDYSFDEKTIDKTSGNATVENILTPIAQKDFIVLDPCTGFGRTMRVSDSLGMRFRGTELNQKRLDKAIKFLRGKYGN